MNRSEIVWVLSKVKKKGTVIYYIAFFIPEPMNVPLCDQHMDRFLLGKQNVLQTELLF